MDLIHMPSKVKGIEQQVMHYLHCLNFVMDCEVYQLHLESADEWDRIVSLMKRFAERDNTKFSGCH